jgi:hypothetical protein
MEKETKKVKKLEELHGGQEEEMTEYIVTMNSGKQIRLLVSAEDWQDECMFMADVINYVDSEGICRYGSKGIKVTTC